MDRPITVAVGTDRLFARFVEVLDRRELADDPRFTSNADRVEHREPLVHELESVLRTRPATSWVEALREIGVPAGLVNGIDEAFGEGISLGLEPIFETERSDGTVIRTVRSPLELSRTPVVAHRAPPALGEHDHELRRWLADEATSAKAWAPGGGASPA